MKLYRYIIRNHITPLLFSCFILIFIFLLQFLMRFADRIVGKGIDTWIILKLVVFNLAWIVVLVVPMSVLIATLMAFGNMSQRNEIAIMKASGISVYKMMIAPLIMSSVIAYLLVQFNNNVYPDANHNARILMSDIARTKPTFSIVPGVFSNDIPNISLLVRDIDPKTNTLKDLSIFNYSNPNSITLITAKKGYITFSTDNKKLILELFDGEIHEKAMTDREIYRRMLFKRHRIGMVSDAFSFSQSTPGGQRGGREMSAADLMEVADSLRNIQKNYKKLFTSEVKRIMLKDDDCYATPKAPEQLVNASISGMMTSNSNIMNAQFQNVKYYEDEVNSYMVEYYKKYSIPVACIIFILIGAPLGIMIRKGGFGMAAGVSLFFFLIYWAFLIGGEKLADRSIVSPFWAMWGANVLMGFFGAIITYRANRELGNLSFDFLKKLTPKNFRKREEEQEDE